MKGQDGSVDWRVSVFLLCYVVVTNWTLLHVFVAILLDNYAIARQATAAAAGAANEPEGGRTRCVNSLDPVLEYLAASHSGDADLSARILDLFKAPAAFRAIARSLYVGKYGHTEASFIISSKGTEEMFHAETGGAIGAAGDGY